MNFRPRHLLIRWLLPLSWRLDRKQKVRVLHEFAQTELDSAWQSLFALEQVRDPETRSLLFMHAFEELHHAEMFTKLASKKSDSVPVLPLTRREPLMEIEGDNPKNSVEFLAFLAIGESEIQKDFELYGRAIPDEDVRQLFRKIREDEEYHAKDSFEALVRLASARGVSLPWVRVRHLAALAWKRYVSLMTKFGAIPMGLLLFLAYFLFGGVFAGQAKRRISLPAKDQLDFLRSQQRSFDRKIGRSR